MQASDASSASAEVKQRADIETGRFGIGREEDTE